MAECDALDVSALLHAETIYCVRRGHAHHHVEEHHLQPGISQRPAAAPALLHQTRQGWRFHTEECLLFFFSFYYGFYI